jgi:hypothetical protein
LTVEATRIGVEATNFTAPTASIRLEAQANLLTADATNSIAVRIR